MFDDESASSDEFLGKFSSKHIIGVGWKKRSGEVFFTRDGEKLNLKKPIQRSMSEQLFPTITWEIDSGTKFTVNVGDTPFKYTFAQHLTPNPHFLLKQLEKYIEMSEKKKSKEQRFLLSFEEASKMSETELNECKALLEKSLEVIRKVKEDPDCCAICMKEKRNVVFLPCRHCVTCTKCSKLVEECPICREKISQSMNIFI